MIDIILTIVLGSLAGVAAFFSCQAIWRVNPAESSHGTDEDLRENYPMGSETSDLSKGAMLRLSVDIKQQELALSENGTTITGSYINIERNRDGMQTCDKIFLN